MPMFQVMTRTSRIVPEMRPRVHRSLLAPGFKSDRATGVATGLEDREAPWQTDTCRGAPRSTLRDPGGVKNHPRITSLPGQEVPESLDPTANGREGGGSHREGHQGCKCLRYETWLEHPEPEPEQEPARCDSERLGHEQKQCSHAPWRESERPLHHPNRTFRQDFGSGPKSSRPLLCLRVRSSVTSSTVSTHEGTDVSSAVPERDRHSPGRVRCSAGENGQACGTEYQKVLVHCLAIQPPERASGRMGQSAQRWRLEHSGHVQADEFASVDLGCIALRSFSEPTSTRNREHGWPVPAEGFPAGLLRYDNIAVARQFAERGPGPEFHREAKPGREPPFVPDQEGEGQGEIQVENDVGGMERGLE